MILVLSLCQDPRVDGPWEVPAGDTLTLKARLSLPSVLVIHVCAQPKAVPDQVSAGRWACGGTEPDSGVQLSPAQSG